MYCWKLKKILDIEDNLNHLHICFDRDIVNTIIHKIKDANGYIELNTESFPVKNPIHLDVGFEKHNRNYLETIDEFKSLNVEIDDSVKEIQFHFENNSAGIKLSKENLEKFLIAIQKSTNFAYIYDNFLEATRIISISETIKSKIIIWAGKDMNVIYC